MKKIYIIPLIILVSGIFNFNYSSPGMGGMYYAALGRALFGYKMDGYIRPYAGIGDDGSSYKVGISSALSLLEHGGERLYVVGGLDVGYYDIEAGSLKSGRGKYLSVLPYLEGAFSIFYFQTGVGRYFGLDSYTESEFGWFVGGGVMLPLEKHLTILFLTRADFILKDHIPTPIMFHGGLSFYF